MSYTLEDYLVDTKITNVELRAFAERRVNLPLEYANDYRARANYLRQRLEKFIDAHDDYDLVKMLHSGSLAKGDALRKIGDLDVAVYIKAAAAPKNDSLLVSWLTNRLKEVFLDFAEDQFDPQDHCVKLLYKTGPSVDVVPVLYEGEPNDVGYLVTKKTGKRVMTSIPLQLEFIRKRKAAQKDHFVQFIRLVKYWVSLQKELDEDFRFKSMMAELICAHLCDNGLDASDYTNALQAFFGYVVQTGLRQPLAFNDYYDSKQIVLTSTPIQIFDPVNPENNISAKYTEEQRKKIVTAAQVAFDAVSTAPYCTTKGESVTMWQQVLGNSFQG
jgi:hypothetical protein